MSNSIVIAASAGQFLSITGNVAANQQKLTLAFWIKRTSISARMVLYEITDGTFNNFFSCDFVNTDVFESGSKTGGVQDYDLDTTATFTDTVNWHHFCLAIDTTQATDTNRVKTYFDGTLITLYSAIQYPVQNANLSTNFASPAYIGQTKGGVNFLDAKLAEFYYIDGQQLDPTFFITGNPGVPRAYTGTYTGVFDSHLNFNNAGNLGADSSGEGNNWASNNGPIQSSDYPYLPALSQPFAGLVQRQQVHTFSNWAYGR